MDESTILSVKNLQTYYPVLGGLLRRRINDVKAVDGVSFNLKRGETLGLVGESGCGKTTIGKTILNLVQSTGGEIIFNNEIISDKKFSMDLRKRIQLVFQDPDASLNPRMKIVDIIGEPLQVLEGIKKRSELRARAYKLLKIVSMKREHLDRYPHEFSGGQKQRIVIARALACDPDIVVLDEPTSALDVSVQAQILNLLKKLQTQFNYSYIFITHDLSVVRHIADRVAVMYLGKFVELGKTKEIFANPSHPYTEALLSARPVIDKTEKKHQIILEGEIPSPVNPPSGCSFHPRCPLIIGNENHGCDLTDPVQVEISEDHYCWCLKREPGYIYKK
jgi:oligopeptide transport system ATP-binding protein